MIEVLTHELGHVYVHPNINTFKIHEIDPVWVKHLELEADTFASEYLLDDDIFEKYIDLSFEQLASELGISTHLVMLKFNNLSNKDVYKRQLIEFATCSNILSKSFSPLYTSNICVLKLIFA